MRQRVALARALVNRPSVLLLDEPLGALDRKLREEMQVELRRIQRDVGTTFIYVTHDQEEALAMSDRVVVMRDGAIEQLGTPAEVYDSPATLWAAGFVGTSNTIAGTVRGLGDLVEIETPDGRLRAAHVHGDGIAPGARITATVRPEHVAVRPGGVAANPAASEVCLEARIEEVLHVANSLRCVAMTGSGHRILAVVERASLRDPIRPGDTVTLAWPASACHVYQ
jgi:spermidine/putrescine transport system ATP-binding protein